MAFTLAHCVTMTSALTGLVNINERCVNMTPRQSEDIYRRSEALLTDTIKLGKVKQIQIHASLFQVKSPPKFRGLENRTAFSRILKEKEKKLSTGESSKLAISLCSKVRLMKKVLKYYSILPMVGSIVISDQSLTRVDDLSEPIRKQGGDAIGVPDKHVQYTQMSLMSRGDCLTRT